MLCVFLFLTFTCHLQLPLCSSFLFLFLRNFTRLFTSRSTFVCVQCLFQQDHSKATYTFLFCSTQRLIHLSFLLVEVSVCFYAYVSFIRLPCCRYFPLPLRLLCTINLPSSFIVCWWCISLWFAVFVLSFVCVLLFLFTTLSV